MDDQRLNTAKHVKYFERFLGLIPVSHQYMDINKLIVIYYSLCGQSLLGIGSLHEKYPTARKTIKSMYQEEGSFAGFIPSKYMDNQNTQNFSLQNTLFGLLCTLLLEDLESLRSFDKKKIFNVVSSCQDKEYGGFRSYIDLEHIDPVDIRYSYMAVSILYILGCRTIDEYAKIIDVEKLLNFIEVHCYCPSYGGFSKSQEPHAGYTSCVASIYKLLALECPHKPQTVDWLVHRQVSHIFEVDHPNFDMEDEGGIQGRENKFADTCYAFWCLNSLHYFADGNINLFDVPKIQDYLLEKTQNTIVGGFSKTNEDDSDIYHSFLGLAALGVISDKFDGYLSVPKRISKLVEQL